MITTEYAITLADRLDPIDDCHVSDFHIACAVALRDLAQQVEDLQKDAARYRWMFKNASTGSIGFLGKFSFHPGDNADEIGILIDEAMQCKVAQNAK